MCLEKKAASRYEDSAGQRIRLQGTDALLRYTPLYPNADKAQ